MTSPAGRGTMDAHIVIKKGCRRISSNGVRAGTGGAAPRHCTIATTFAERGRLDFSSTSWACFSTAIYPRTRRLHIAASGPPGLSSSTPKLSTEGQAGPARTCREEGFFHPPSELFRNVLSRAKDDENLNETWSGCTRTRGSRGDQQRSQLQGPVRRLGVTRQLGPTVKKRTSASRSS
jgi:hypothetical protein